MHDRLVVLPCVHIPCFMCIFFVSLPPVCYTQIMKEDDGKWPEPDKVGRQELEIMMGDDHISFATTKLGSMVQIQSSEDAEGLKVFYYLVQDIKCLAFSLISSHFKIQPI